MDFVDFLQTQSFSAAWEGLGLGDEELQILELAIGVRPKANPVIPGTGGLRKMRFAPAGSQQGKRGGLRVCYVYFETAGLVLLVLVYSKRKRDDLTPAAKKVIRALIEEQQKALETKRSGGIAR